MTRQSGYAARRLAIVGALAALFVGIDPARPEAQGGGGPSEVASLIQFARNDINGYWARTIKGYTPPADVLMVRAPTTTDCGPFTRPNAAYCGSTNKIYWDLGFFTEQRKIGDFAPVFILAHEWGHMVQRMLGFARTDRGLLTVQLELQADCFAGEYAADARTRKVLEAGDDDEAAVSLRRAGDGIDAPWFDSSAHGTAGQRIDAFGYGFDGRDCAADAFFDFLKTRGIDPARVQQTPAPTAGSLASMLPKQAGRFTMVDVKRVQVEGAIDTLRAQYRTPDGLIANCKLSAFQDATVSRDVLASVVSLLTTQHGYKEIKRADIVDKNTKEPIGVVVTLQGQNDIVVWINRHTLSLVDGPRDVAFELYNALPF